MLFDNLPKQPTPRVLVMGDHALVLCSVCDGTGKGELVWPECERRCSACKGAGHVLRRVTSAKEA